MNSKPLSQDEFQAKKAEALQNEPIAKSVRLNQIEMTDDSLAAGVVKIAGKTISANTGFFKGLGKILNISDGLRRDLTGGKDAKKEQSALFSKMVETLKLLKSSKNGGGEVTIIGNPTDGSLTGITDKGYNRIPNADLFGIAESLVNRYPILSPVEIDVRNGGMGVGISLLSSAQHPFKPVGGPDGGDETFNFGFTLNNGSITSLGDFAYRLVCSNGMMGMSKMDQFMLRDMSADSIRKMFKHIQEAQQRNFIPVTFGKNMEIAGRTNASFREIEKLYKDVSGLISCEDETLKKHFKRELAQTFFRGYVTTSAKLMNNGYDPANLTDKEKSFINSGQKMWDVINGLTWLGSHDGGITWKNQALLRKIGGKTLGEEFDLANAHLLNF